MATPKALEARVAELEWLVKILFLAFDQALRIDPHAVAAQKSLKR